MLDLQFDRQGKSKQKAKAASLPYHSMKKIVCCFKQVRTQLQISQTSKSLRKDYFLGNFKCHRDFLASRIWFHRELDGNGKGVWGGALFPVCGLFLAILLKLDVMYMYQKHDNTDKNRTI